MAITFSKDISTTRLLMAYNNNVVKFASDHTSPAMYCDVTGGGIEAKIYPHPDGTFRFDFRQWIPDLINTRNFVDDTVTDLGALPESYTYDFADGSYLTAVFTFLISFEDETTESTTRDLKFIAGANQLEDYKRGAILIDSPVVVLTPVSNTANNQCYLKFWEGYPFDFTYYTTTEDLLIENMTNLVDCTVPSPNRVNRLFFSDGRIDVSLQDLLPLALGINVLNLNEGDYYVNLDKSDTDCGVYLKWVNATGTGYNYWLFNRQYTADRSTKSLGELDNDFYNLEDSFGRTTQIGKTSQDVWKIAADGLSPDQSLLIQGIIDSPKVYLFTGEPFSQSDHSDWMEVNLKPGNERIKNAKNPLMNYAFDIELPKRNTITL